MQDGIDFFAKRNFLSDRSCNNCHYFVLENNECLRKREKRFPLSLHCWRKETVEEIPTEEECAGCGTLCPITKLAGSHLIDSVSGKLCPDCRVEIKRAGGSWLTKYVESDLLKVQVEHVTSRVSKKLATLIWKWFREQKGTIA